MQFRIHTVPLAVVALFATVPALACSICRCGDPTFNALGKEGVPQSGLRIAVDGDYTHKTQGPADERDELTETRMTLLAAYAVSDRVALFARLPYSWRELRESEDGDIERSQASGLSDPELYGQVRLWSSPFEGDVGLRASLYLVAGVKTPWGENDVQIDGERGDEHVQPGTGSTDWFGGLAGSYQINPSSAVFASLQYRATGRNDSGYEYGNIWLANIAVEHKFTPRLDTALELNYRNAGRDVVDREGNLDGDTGGSMLFVTPRVLFNVGSNWVWRAGVQLPITQSGLNGEQHEDAVFSLGVTYLLNR
ncbi:MAG TPA: transporter [Povalibacter sp.]|nr:transporter [Povalibacter sp.]